MRRTILATILTAAVVASAGAQEEEPVAPTSPAAPVPRPMGELGPGVPRFTVRPGYRVTRASVPGLVRDAGFLAAGPRRALFVAERSHGAIALLRDEDRDDVYEVAITFLENQPQVHALQYSRGWLYFSTPTAIGRARDTDGDLMADDVEMIVEGLEGGGGHDARAILVTRNHVYTAIGDSGNITDEIMTDRQKIWRYNLDGGGRVLWASGIRNTQELAARPGTGEVWGIDQGSDGFGMPLGEDEAGDAGEADAAAQPVTDAFPPDEFNRYDEGGFYGHPFIVAPRVPRYEFTRRPDILELAAKTTPPQWLLGAHGGASGWAFVSLRNPHFPHNHRGDAFVACHGARSDSGATGYRIERVLFDDWTGLPYGSQMVVGTLDEEGGGEVLARPVDVVEVIGGTLIFSSDAPEPALFRLEWAAATPPATTPPTTPPAGSAPADAPDGL